MPPLAVASAGIAVGLYFLLIPPFSFVGAAWATAAAFTRLALLVLVGLAPHLPGAVGLAPDGSRRRPHGRGPCSRSGSTRGSRFASSIPVRLAITAAFPLLLYALGFFPPGDLAAGTLAPPQAPTG